MKVMTLVAAIVESICRGVAGECRRNGTYPCGWQPAFDADVEALQAAPAVTILIWRRSRQHVTQAAGRT
jgi:hypothetical protein